MTCMPKLLIKCILLFLVLGWLSSSCAGSKQASLRRRLQVEQQDPCLVLFRNEVQADLNETTSLACQLQGRDAAAFGPLILDIENLTPEWATSYDIVSGESTLHVPGTVILNDRLQLPASANMEAVGANYTTNYNYFVRGTGMGKKNRRLATTTGSKSVLVVRVAAADFQTSSDAGRLSDEIFGTQGDAVTLVERFRECSFGQLVFYPTADSRATKGVYTVSIPQRVQDNSERNVERFVLAKLKQDMGDLPSQFDHVMFCLPYNTNRGTWLAYGYLNYWLTVFNDKWCESPTAQAHELGHNLFLSHSGEGGNPYGDQSGIMGYSYAQDDGPIMCFNAVKSWQLGWYSDRQNTATPLTSKWDWKLVGLADYLDSHGKTVILKIEGEPSTDYYVNFNRKSGVNVGTMEGGDQVLVTQRPKGTAYASSFLVAKLGAGGKHSVSNFGGGGETMTITVNSISWSTTPVYAEVTVSSTAIERSPQTTPRPTPRPPTRAPTARPTPSPTARPTPSPTPRPTMSVPTPLTPSTPRPSPTPSPTSFPTVTTPPPTPAGQRITCANFTKDKNCKRQKGQCEWDKKKKQCLAVTTQDQPSPQEDRSLCSFLSSKRSCDKEKKKCKWDKKKEVCKEK